MVFRRKKALKKAAVGSAKITSFFQSKETIDGANIEPEVDTDTPQPPQSAQVASSCMDFCANNQPTVTGYSRQAPETPKSPACTTTTVHETAVLSVSVSSSAEQGLTSTGIESGAGYEQTRGSQERDPLHLEFLDVTNDDEEEDQRPVVGIIVGRLMEEATKHHAFASLFKLQAVKRYLEIYEKYKNIPLIKNPRGRASTAVAVSVGKGPFFAKQIRRLTIYIDRFHSLPPMGAGKHHAHPSLLNDERILHAVRRYLTVTELGEVRK